MDLAPPSPLDESPKKKRLQRWLNIGNELFLYAHLHSDPRYGGADRPVGWGRPRSGPLDPPAQLRLRRLPVANEPEPPASTSAESAVDVPAEPILIFADEDGGEGDIQAYCMGGCGGRSEPLLIRAAAHPARKTYA